MKTFKQWLENSNIVEPTPKRNWFFFKKYGPYASVELKNIGINPHDLIQRSDMENPIEAKNTPLFRKFS